MMNLNNEGQPIGEPLHFSRKQGYVGEYPSPNYGVETYVQYRGRLIVLSLLGFSISDLTFADYEIYCKGSGTYDDFNPNQLIEL